LFQVLFFVLVGETTKEIG